MISIILAIICIATMTHNAIRIKDQRLAWTCGALMAVHWFLAAVMLYSIQNP